MLGARRARLLDDVFEFLKFGKVLRLVGLDRLFEDHPAITSLLFVIIVVLVIFVKRHLATLSRRSEGKTP